MPDYQAMYGKLFRAMTKAISMLQQAQQETEELYITANQPNITVLEKPNAESDGENKT